MATEGGEDVARVLRDLEQRLLGKAGVLRDMATLHPNYVDNRRLLGKAEGVELSLSFVQEYLREWS